MFWNDYFNLNLALSDTPNGIAERVSAHEKYAGGNTEVLYVDDNLYIMQRTGFDDKPGLSFIVNYFQVTTLIIDEPSHRLRRFFNQDDFPLFQWERAGAALSLSKW